MIISMFLRSLLLSVYLSPIILMILLLLRCFGNRYTAQSKCALLTINLLSLILPVNLIFNFFGKNSIVLNNNIISSVDLDAVRNALQTDITTVYSGQSNMSDASNILKFTSILALLYFSGVVLLSIYYLIKYFRVYKFLGRNSEDINEYEAQILLIKIKKELSIRKPIKLKTSSKITSPMLIGLFSPTIYLPQKNISTVDLYNILKHELWHYKRKDLWLKLFSLVVTILYWYNPLVYFLTSQLALNIEQACDSSVLKNLKVEDRKQYALTILSFVGIKNTHPVTTNFKGRNNKHMKKRFMNIISQNKNKRETILVFLLATVLMIVAVGCGVSTAEAIGVKDTLETVDIISDELYDVEVDEAPYDIEAVELKSDIDFMWPVPEHYDITGKFGMSVDSNGEANFNTGITISDLTIENASVVASSDGVIKTIVYSNSNMGLGNNIVIEHGNGIETRYSHLADVLVKEGQEVKTGEIIGLVGSSGYPSLPCLLFDIYQDNIAVDPAIYLLKSIEK